MSVPAELIVRGAKAPVKVDFEYQTAEEAAKAWHDRMPWSRDTYLNMTKAVLEEVGFADLLEAAKAALPFVAHFRGGWSEHTSGDINSELLAQQLEAAIAKAEGRT